MGKERRKRQEKKGRSEKEGLRKKWKIWKTRVSELMKDGEVKGWRDVGGRGNREERGKQEENEGRLVLGWKGERKKGKVDVRK